MLKYFCDKCNKEISEHDSAKNEWDKFISAGNIHESGWLEYHFCNDCNKLMEKFVRE
jgi:hypothetical protein